MSFNWIVLVWKFISAVPQATLDICWEIIKSLGEIAVHFWLLGGLIWKLVVSIKDIITNNK
jgi:hypothetical protein